MHHGLRVDLDSHSWLLHHLFLAGLNSEIWEWGETWNAHKLRIRHERQTSPRDLFSFGVITHGLYSPHPNALAGRDIATLDEAVEYGIDWADWEETNLRQHHLTANGIEAEEVDDAEPFDANPIPGIHVPRSECPIDDEGLRNIESHLRERFGSNWRSARNMFHREQVWFEALSFCQLHYEQFR
jgi:hypothetical protein